MKILKFLRGLLMVAMVCGSFLATHAQSGQRYAEPVFETVNMIDGIRYSSAIKEGASSPTDLYLDFYEPEGDTFTKRPLVITVFGGAFVAGGRDFVDMQAYCTRLAQHGYVAASIAFDMANQPHGIDARCLYGDSGCQLCHQVPQIPLRRV